MTPHPILVALAVALLIVGMIYLVHRLSRPSKHTLDDWRRSRVKTGSLRVLFVGDSFVFKNNMPSILQSLLGVGSIVNMQVKPGRTLSDAYKSSDARNAVSSGTYDYLVLQDQSTNPLYDVNDFSTAVQNFITLNAGKAKVILFEPWINNSNSALYGKGSSGFCKKLGLCDSTGNGSNPQIVQAAVKQIFQKEASQLGSAASVIYLGEAFMSAGDLRESLLMTTCDDVHPSLAGSYFIALLFYRFLMGTTDFSGLPSTYTGCDDCAAGTGCLDCCANIGKKCGSCTLVNSTIDASTMTTLKNMAQTAPING
jgi:hypothetical protein